MRKRLKEIEEEAGALREMQAKVEKEMGAVQGVLCLYFLFFMIFLLDKCCGFSNLAVRFCGTKLASSFLGFRLCEGKQRSLLGT